VIQCCRAGDDGDSEVGTGEVPDLKIRQIRYAARVFRDVQRERGGVIAGERVRDMKGPPGRLPGGAWCSRCRRGARSDEVISLTAARGADWSTILLPVT
jgi:hypothetical protein